MEEDLVLVVLVVVVDSGIIITDTRTITSNRVIIVILEVEQILPIAVQAE